MLNYQRVNLHFPMVFLWFSYGFPIETSIFHGENLPFWYVYQAGYNSDSTDVCGDATMPRLTLSPRFPRDTADAAMLERRRAEDMAQGLRSAKSSCPGNWEPWHGKFVGKSSENHEIAGFKFKHYVFMVSIYKGWCARLTQVFELEVNLVAGFKHDWIMTFHFIKKGCHPKPIDELCIFFKMGTLHHQPGSHCCDATAALAHVNWFWCFEWHSVCPWSGAAAKSGAVLCCAGRVSGWTRFTMDAGLCLMIFVLLLVFRCLLLVFFRSQKKLFFPSHWLIVT